MIRNFIRMASLMLCLAALPLTGTAQTKDREPIHMINDVTHDYSFFYAWSNPRNFGGKYGYVDKASGSKMTQSQATISTIDLTNYNLFNVFLNRKWDLAYLDDDVTALTQFAERDGGGVFLVLSSDDQQDASKADAFVSQFGASFGKAGSGKISLTDHAINQGINKLSAVRNYRTLVLTPNIGWEVIATDKAGAPLMAIRKVGKGHVAVSGFTPFVKAPKASVNNAKRGFRFANYAFSQALMQQLASGKAVDPSAKLVDAFRPDRVTELGAINIRSTAYSEHIVENVIRDYKKVAPVMESYLGVPLAAVDSNDKMTIDLLATYGSGVSRGSQIGIGMMKESFYGILGHEMAHSWVLPHTEPLSNEGIAIWIGSNIRIMLGERAEGEKAIAQRVNGARNNPNFMKWDPARSRRDGNFPKALTHGKYMIILQHFEQKYGQEILAKYFQAKRQLAPAGISQRFSVHDSAAIWSYVTGEDQFSYMNSLGISVDPAKVTLPASK